VNPFGHIDLRVRSVEMSSVSPSSRVTPARQSSAGPKEMPYQAGDYAVYFADPSGNRFEVYYRPDT
jgi:hypothetical protein